jgi:hypothetical protein
MNIPFVEMKISKLINYSMNMCWNGHGTMVLVLGLSSFEIEIEYASDLSTLESALVGN